MLVIAASAHRRYAMVSRTDRQRATLKPMGTIAGVPGLEALKRNA